MSLWNPRKEIPKIDLRLSKSTKQICPNYRAKGQQGEVAGGGGQFHCLCLGTFGTESGKNPPSFSWAFN